MDGSVIPGVQVVRRPLHILFCVDRSKSMDGIRINAINQGIPAALHAVSQSMKQHPEVEVFVHVLAFGSDLEWILDDVPIGSVQWRDITAKGKTNTGTAINELCDKLSVNNIGDRGYPPVCILLSDGYHSDSNMIYDQAIERLNTIPWGRKAIRLVIGIGNPEDYDEGSLARFGNQQVKIIKVEDCRDLVKYIQWASVAASIGATRSRSSATGDLTNNVELPMIPKGDDVW